VLTLRLEGNWPTVLSVLAIVLAVFFYALFVTVRAAVRSGLDEEAVRRRRDAAARRHRHTAPSSLGPRP
jgi:predicted secreted protein